MSDRNFEEQDEIQRILGESSRLRYVLSTHHGVALDAVTSLRVDGDNAKIDVWVGERMMRFKAKGTQRVLATQPDGGGMAMTLDPALAQAIYEIVGDYAG